MSWATGPCGAQGSLPGGRARADELRMLLADTLRTGALDVADDEQLQRLGERLTAMLAGATRPARRSAPRRARSMTTPRRATRARSATPSAPTTSSSCSTRPRPSSSSRSASAAPTRSGRSPWTLRRRPPPARRSSSSAVPHPRSTPDVVETPGAIAALSRPPTPSPPRTRRRSWAGRASSRTSSAATAARRSAARGTHARSSPCAERPPSRAPRPDGARRTRGSVPPGPRRRAGRPPALRARARGAGCPGRCSATRSAAPRRR